MYKVVYIDWIGREVTDYAFASGIFEAIEIAENWQGVQQVLTVTKEGDNVKKGN